DPRDVGCAEAIEMLHVYAELVASGAPRRSFTRASRRTCARAARAGKTSRGCWPRSATTGNNCWPCGTATCNLSRRYSFAWQTLPLSLALPSHPTVLRRSTTHGGLRSELATPAVAPRGRADSSGARERDRACPAARPAARPP